MRTGHEVARKKYGAALRGRCDSRVVKTNVHFPTDVGLLWDAARGLIRSCARAAAAFDVPGWRKHADRSRKVYRAYSRVRTAPRYRHNPKGVKAYVRLCQKNAARARALLNALAEEKDSAKAQEEIGYYLQYVDLLTDQVCRRILEGKRIPHEEKVFSIHKPHTRWDRQGQGGGVGGAGPSGGAGGGRAPVHPGASNSVEVNRTWMWRCR